jgi:hypothetical protein
VFITVPDVLSTYTKNAGTSIWRRLTKTDPPFHPYPYHPGPVMLYLFQLSL